MTRTLALLMPAVASVFALSPATAGAETACSSARAVDLAIELEPPDAQVQSQIEQRLAAELGARGVAVCPPAPEGRLAHLRVRAKSPELTPARVLIQVEGGVPIERRLDLAALPREARRSALASSTDELLASMLALPVGLATESKPSADASSSIPAPAAPSIAAPMPSDPGQSSGAAHPVPWRPPQLELGVGGGAARFGGEAIGYTAELLARWWPLPRASLTAHGGPSRGHLNDSAWGERSTAWLAGLDVGFELLEATEGFGVAARAGAVLGRVKRTVEIDVATPVGAAAVDRDAGKSWEVAATAGAEAGFRVGPVVFTLDAMVLVPLTPSRPRLALPDFSYPPSVAGLGETLGGQLDLRVWLALDGSS